MNAVQIEFFNSHELTWEKARELVAAGVARGPEIYPEQDGWALAVDLGEADVFEAISTGLMVRTKSGSYDLKTWATPEAVRADLRAAGYTGGVTVHYPDC